MPADPRTPRQEQIQCQELSEIPQWAMETANRIGMMMPLDSQTKISHAARIIAEACQQQIAAAAQARLELAREIKHRMVIIGREIFMPRQKWQEELEDELDKCIAECEAAVKEPTK